MKIRYSTRMGKSSTWGLVLSGGAAWGIANAGVIEVLEKEGLEPDFVAGSSMGSIVAALYALGLRSKEMKEILEKMKVYKIAALSETPFKDGLHGGLFRQQVEDLLAPILGDSVIGNCQIPFVCVAGKVHKPIRWERIVLPTFVKELEDIVEPVTFGKDVRIIDAILASSAIPVLFSPYRIDGEEYIDLCNFGAIPARSLKARYHPNRIIAVDTAFRHESLKKILPHGWRKFLEASNKNIEESREICDFITEPVIPYAYYRFDKAAEIYEAGRAEAEKDLPEIVKIVRKDAMHENEPIL